MFIPIVVSAGDVINAQLICGTVTLCLFGSIAVEKRILLETIIVIVARMVVAFSIVFLSTPVMVVGVSIQLASNSGAFQLTRASEKL